MTYILGQHNFICDVCGLEYKSSQKRKLWSGLIVCPDDYEVDHPQKYIRVQPDGQSVPDPRPEPADVFVAHICYMYALHSYADMGEADCMVADKTTLTYNYCRELKGVT